MIDHKPKNDKKDNPAGESRDKNGKRNRQPPQQARRAVTDADIQAFVDRSLPPERYGIVFTALAADQALRGRFLQLTRQKALLKRWFAEH